MQDGGPDARIEPQQPLLDPRRLAAAGRHHQRHRQPRDPAGQIIDKPQRRRIRPVGVVHKQRHRPVVGQVRHQPVEAVERGEAGGISDSARVELGMLEQRAGEARGSREGRLALHIAELRQRRLEQLPRNSKGKARLELRPPRHEHPQRSPFGWPPARAAAPPSSPDRGPPDRDRPRGRPRRTPTAPSPPPRRSQTTQDAPPAATPAGSAATTTPAHDHTQGSSGHGRIVPTGPDDTAPLCNSHRELQESTTQRPRFRKGRAPLVSTPRRALG
jgi:hypothetical protein